MKLTWGIPLDALFLLLLLCCSISDLRKRTISNKLIISLLCLDFVHILSASIAGTAWWHYPAGLLLFIPFYLIWSRDCMGAGDVKLIAAIALYLGLINTIASFALMIPILASFFLRSWLMHQPVNNRIPLAPVISIGAAGTVVLGYILLLVNH